MSEMELQKVDQRWAFSAIFSAFWGELGTNRFGLAEDRVGFVDALHVLLQLRNFPL